MDIIQPILHNNESFFSANFHIYVVASQATSYRISLKQKCFFQSKVFSSAGWKYFEKYIFLRNIYF